MTNLHGNFSAQLLYFSASEFVWFFFTFSICWYSHLRRTMSSWFVSLSICILFYFVEHSCDSYFKFFERKIIDLLFYKFDVCSFILLLYSCLVFLFLNALWSSYEIWAFEKTITTSFFIHWLYEFEDLHRSSQQEVLKSQKLSLIDLFKTEMI